MELKRNKNITKRRCEQGMALLLTLMVLMILTTVMVQFQVDAALFLRSSHYRLEKQQCRYAAESGLVIASTLLLEKLQSGEPLTGIAPSSDAMTRSLPDLSGLRSNDPNGMDLNIILDPNQSDFSESLGSDSVVVLFEKDVEVGQAKVSLEIYDENAKWPMLWLIPNGSPFSQSRNSQAITEFDQLTNLLHVDGRDSSAVKRLTKEIGLQLKMPPAEFVVQKGPVSQIRRRGGHRRRRTRRVRYRRGGYAKRIQEAKQRQSSMAQFAQIFNERLDTDSELFGLKDNLEERDMTLMDYLGFWGHNKVNLNSAPIEVLQSVFSSLGVTQEQVLAIDDYRQRQPFKRTSELRNIDTISRDLVQAMMPLCTVRSDTFTIKITAQLGRTEYRVLGAVHYNRGRMEPLAMIDD